MTDGFARDIDLADSEQVADWCKRMRCTETLLREAVRMVGPSYVLVDQWVTWQRPRP